MPPEATNLHLVLILTLGFGFASVLGYITQYFKLSPILGYMIAGYIIGPFSPGIEADLHTAEQLAEIGVVLMMFGVGLHFKLEDLIKVKSVAIPGAICQIVTSALSAVIVVYALGWSISSGVIIGLAISVASTVVLVRVLTDNNLLNSLQGHIAVGWLVVEDIFTVAVLIFIPTLASYFEGYSVSTMSIILTVVTIFFKFALLAMIMFTLGKTVVTEVLMRVARMRSHELFTLTILALTFIIAMGSALLFGTSIALGAFIAGMVIGQTEVRHQASANSLPLKDAFVVLFFVSVGMLFNPEAISSNFVMFISILAIILIVKPLAAYFITAVLRYPFRVSLTVAIALAQIGEFSFILVEEAMKYNIIPDEGFDIIVACALITIALNPIIFRYVEPLSTYFDMDKDKTLPDRIHSAQVKKAIVVGYGPVGRRCVETLENEGYTVTIIDQNVDTIQAEGYARDSLFGDASQADILESAKIKDAKVLVITIPDTDAATQIIDTAHHINPDIKLLTRIKFFQDIESVKTTVAHYVCDEEITAKKMQEELKRIISTVALG